MTVIVTYDITRDDRRARLAALLQTWCDRIQYSVFLMTMSPDDLAGLKTRVADIIDPDHDSVYFLRQCKSCWQDHGELGQADLEPEAMYWAAL